MNKYISLIRGINVSGQKIIKMEELKSLYEDLGFQEVKTYIQSGNVIFCSTLTNENKIKLMIQNEIQTHFNFEVTVIILSENKLREIISQIPFDIDKIDLKKFCICFLEKTPSQELLNQLLKIKIENEEFKVRKDGIYIYYPLGFGSAKFNNNFIENKLKLKATSRNWNTTNKLLALITELQCK